MGSTAGMSPASSAAGKTDGYEGFFHLDALTGTTASAHMEYIIRDHDRAKFEEKKALMERSAAQVGAAHPTARVELTLKDSYYNMKEKLTDCMHLVDNAKRADTRPGWICPAGDAWRRNGQSDRNGRCGTSWTSLLFAR